MTVSIRDIRIKLANAAVRAIKTDSGEIQVALTPDELDLLLHVLETHPPVAEPAPTWEEYLELLKARRQDWIARNASKSMLEELDAEIAEIQRKLGEMLPPNPNDLRNVNA